MGNLKTRYRKLQAFADGGAVEAADDLDPSDALKAQIEKLRTAEEGQRAAQAVQPAPEPKIEDDVAAALEKTQLPYLAKKWLREHPEYVLDQTKNARIANLHYDLMEEGLEPYSEPYFREVERRLLEPPAAPSPAGEVFESENSRIVLDAPKRRKPVEEPIETPGVRYSAPVSRSVPQSNGKRYSDNSVTLTLAQKEAARISGVSEADYARHLLELNRRKAQGDFGGSP